jgi:two-component system LytT family response regulator
MIKALIVDDEYTSVDLLQWLIAQHCPDITAVKTARNIQEGLAQISTFNPDIVFLDIRMPNQSGFDMLTAIEQWNFEVIFITAYNEYAIQAIRFSALDYLLKPVEEEELIKAVERFKRKRLQAKGGGHELFRNFISNLTDKTKSQFKLALPTAGEVYYVSVAEIVRLQAERNYTRIYFSGRPPVVSAKTLKEYEELLDEYGFIRVHKSHLVNITHITRYDRDGWLQTDDGSRVEVARRKKEYLLRTMKGK